MEKEEQQHEKNNNMNGRGQNGSNNSNYSCDFWELGTTSWSNNSNNPYSEDNTGNNTTLMFSNPLNTHFHNHNPQTLQLNHQNNQNPDHHYNHHHHNSFYTGGSNLLPDPHLTCLKLGKRHYFEDGNGNVNDGLILGEEHVSGFQIGKRGRSYDGVGDVLGTVGFGRPSSSSSSSSSVGVEVGLIGLSRVVVPRCQVEGCHVALSHAKDYHRRHKVCEMHSKAPKVTVLGIVQRFCQQCSRFHVISEFDDLKRSCRRRLAGHNERRRKSSYDSISRNPSQETKLTDRRFSFISTTTGRAPSLLSSKSNSWVSPTDLSTRSSAALRELIAENRGAVLAQQLFLDQNWHQHGMDQKNHESQVEITSTVPLPHQFSESSEWDSFQESDAHVTLDLMQTPSLPFGFLSRRSKSKEEEEEEDCCEIWKSLEGTHIA